MHRIFCQHQASFLSIACMCLGLLSCEGARAPSPPPAPEPLPPPAIKFAATMFPNLKPYVDSVFITKDGNRIYFLHSIYAPRVMNGTAPPSACTTGTLLPNHVTATNLEWNTDLYYVEWDGLKWSAPINLGAQINTFGNECCVWLNDAETEIIFYRGTDLDGTGPNPYLPPPGNYRATRTDKNAAWEPATALSGVYGTQNQTSSAYRHDVHKVPSNNYYLWEKAVGVSGRLLFGSWNGSSYDAPVLIPGSGIEDSQIWAADDEKTIVYNRRSGATTDLYKMSRPSTAAPWGMPRKSPPRVSRIPSAGASGASPRLTRRNHSCCMCASIRRMSIAGRPTSYTPRET